MQYITNSMSREYAYQQLCISSEQLSLLYLYPILCAGPIQTMAEDRICKHLLKNGQSRDLANKIFSKIIIIGSATT